MKKWYCEKSHITASEKRILITYWAGNIYGKPCESHYDNFRWWLFEKTCCLITVDGSEDAKVTPERLLNYKLQPPIDIDPIAAPVTLSTVPSPEPNVDEEDETKRMRETILRVKMSMIMWKSFETMTFPTMVEFLTYLICDFYKNRLYRDLVWVWYILFAFCYRLFCCVSNDR